MQRIGVFPCNWNVHARRYALWRRKNHDILGRAPGESARGNESRGVQMVFILGYSQLMSLQVDQCSSHSVPMMELQLSCAQRILPIHPLSRSPGPHPCSIAASVLSRLDINEDPIAPSYLPVTPLRLASCMLWVRLRGPQVSWFWAWKILSVPSDASHYQIV